MAHWSSSSNGATARTCSNLLGFTSSGCIDSLIPIVLFSMPFGPSMDYEMFLLTRIREEWLRTSNNRQAVVYGLEKTSNAITNAALLGLGFAPLLASLLIGMPAWVMALTETTRRKRWGWFVAVLLLSPVAAMLYGFFGAQPHPPAAPAAPTLAASGA